MTYDFEADLRHQILTIMPCEDADRPALEALETYQLAFHYWNWRLRFVPAQKYDVHISDKLLKNPGAAGPSFETALYFLTDQLLAGKDIAPHLSRGIRFGFVDQKGPQKNLGERRDLDLLLNDWGIHHLHLSTELDADGFVARTKPLLFAAFMGTDAYLIDIFDHDAWANVDIIRIIARNWPQSGLILENNRFLLPEQSPSDAERVQLRSGGLSTYIEVDGKAYLARGLLATNGMSSYASQAQRQLLSLWKRFDKQLPSPEQWVRDMMLKENVTPPCELDLHFRLLQSGYDICEYNTMFRIPLA